MNDYPGDVDVVIVGSGPSGAVYARTVADAVPSARILIVEAGPAASGWPGRHVSEIADAGARDLATMRCQGPQQVRRAVHAASGIAHNIAREQRDQAFLHRPGLFPIDPGGDLPAAQAACAVGGMATTWFAACPRPGGTERIGFLDEATLAGALATAERLLRVSVGQLSSGPAETHLRQRLSAALDGGRMPDRRVQPMPMAFEAVGGTVRRFGAGIILGDLLDRGNVTLCARTLCQRMLTDDSGVAGVRLRDQDTAAVHTVRARHVVVAADSFRTPQLLFASGIRPPALGRHLNEHPQVSVPVQLDDFTGPIPTGPARGVTWIPYDDATFPFHGMVTPLDPATLPAAMAGRPVAAVHLYLPQDVNPANHVIFSEDELDWAGMPAMCLHHRPSSGDRAVLDAARDAALRLSRILGRPAAGEAPWVHPAGSSLHYQGTVRMGPADDGTSVCDPASRVWQAPGLYVAGNGVIPGRTACNPTLTSAALAVLGARDLSERLGGSAFDRR